jgi:hypothetical protein
VAKRQSVKPAGSKAIAQRKPNDKGALSGLLCCGGAPYCQGGESSSKNLYEHPPPVLRLSTGELQLLSSDYNSH